MNKIRFRLQNIHFIGIGGSGMNGIAEVLFNLGYKITGSDTCPNENTKRLTKLGIQIYYGHQEKNIKNAQAIVISSAIKNDNIELIKAKENKMPIVPRAQMLAELMRFNFGIAISGTHGKTTTTSIISHIMLQAGLDPTYIIGGILKSDGIGNRLGKNNYLVAEADESDGSFLYLNPMLSVITNIDKDHMQTYDFDYKKLQQAFIDFTAKLPFYGLCIVCIDDNGIKDIINKIGRQVITYGLDNQADIYAKNIKYKNFSSSFEVVNKNSKFNATIPLIGKHNILNTLAAIGICQELKINNSTIAAALNNFQGAKRRIDFKGKIKINNKAIKVFDDYGHHPTEIKTVIDGIKRSFPKNKLLVIFQPHRYSRTQDLFDDFSVELGKIENLILLPVYAAGEAEISGANSQSLANNIRSRTNNQTIVAKDFKDCKNIIKNTCDKFNIILTLGAGDVVDIAEYLIKKYAN